MSVLPVFIAVIVSVVIGFRHKINVGWLALAFAFVLGIFLYGFSGNQIIAMWPTKLFFQMVTVMFFYNFAVNNGTLVLVAQKTIYLTRKVPFLTPFILWILVAVMAGIGPGAVSIFLAMPPILMVVAEQMNLNPLMVPVITVTAGTAGGWSPIAIQGLLTQSLIESAGYSAEEAYPMMLTVWHNTVLSGAIIFLIGYFAFGAFRCHTVSDQEKPPAFLKEQRVNIVLILMALSILIVPSALAKLTGSPEWNAFSKKIDITYICILFALAAIFCKVGDAEKAMNDIPWNTIIMLCGTGTLLAVASSAGILKELANLISSSMPVPAIPYIISLVSAVMSLFSSTTGVVMPTLFPLVYSISAETQLAPAILFSAVTIASTYAGMSPFSTAGGLALTALNEKNDKNRFMIQLIITAVLAVFCVLIFIAAGIFFE